MLKFAIVLLIGLFSLVHGAPSNGSYSWKVVGGSDAPEGVAPYQIIIKIKPEFFMCSGTILSKTCILTAAHCISGYDMESFYVVAGTNQLSSGGENYDVSHIKVHEEYNDWKISNDVGLIFLKKEIIFSDRIKPIVLNENYIGAEVPAIITGWGRVNNPGEVAENLQILILSTISFDDCKNRWIDGNEVFESQICTLTKKGEGACHGDSGGPLTVGETQVGIVSWGNPCANGYPDVYTRISFFVDWIKKNMK